MISKSMSALVAGGSVIRAMFEEGKKMAAEFGAENVYDFSLGNPCTPPPEEVRREAIRILSEEDESVLHGYMSNAGYPEVRASLAASENRKWGTHYTANNFLMTVGAAGALNVALKMLLEPGDEVMLFAPYFGEYNNYIANFGGVRVVVPADTENFSLNLEAAEALFTERTRALIINTPNNPTGVIYSADTLRALAELLHKKEAEYGHAIYLISDEPYREIVFGGQEVPHLPLFYENTMVGYSYSKSLSLPGERIGYLLIPDSVEDAENTQAAAAVANRILGFVNAPSLFQKVIGELPDCTSDMSVYRENRELLLNELTALGFELVAPQGAFYMFPRCPFPDDRAFCALAKEYHILVVPGSTFGCPGFFRLAFCVSPETVRRSLPAFRALAERCGCPVRK